MNDLYQILGLNSEASQSEIKEAYRKLAIKFHPDKNDGDKYFEEWSKKINHAYEILSNPEKRNEYDKSQNHSNKTHSQNSNYHNTSSDQQTRQFLRNNYSDYRLQRRNFQRAQNNLNTILASQSEKHFTTIKLFIGIIGILIGIIGIKKTSGISFKNTEQTEQNSYDKRDDSQQESKTKVNQEVDRPKYVYNDEETEFDISDATPISQELILSSSKAFLYTTPIDKISNGTYLLKGEVVIAKYEYQGFVYIETNNRNGGVTEGWLKRYQLDIYTPVEIETIDESEQENMASDIQEDTAKVKKKKGIFKRIFGKKDK